MTAKSLAYLLSCFERYPRTQQSLSALYECTNLAITENTARVLQTIALKEIPGDFDLSPDELEKINNSLKLLAQIHQVVEIFLREQSGEPEA